MLVLAALMALLLVRVPYAASHQDLARDMFVAWRLLHGEAWPLEGPQLAGLIHLGPVWYYVLALLQLIGRNWYGTLALLCLLASLQMPVAYLLGKELHSRRAGLLWAVGLLVPSWSTYEWMLPLHTILSTLFVLAFLLCCARYWRGGQRRYFYGMALTFMLAFHAHPSSVGIALVGLFVIVRARHQRVKWRDYVLAGLIVVAPLLPFLYVDALRGFEDLRKSSAWVAKGDATGSLWNAPALFVAIVYGGTRYLFDPLTGMGARIAQIAACVIALGGVAGGIGLLLGWRARGTRALIGFALAATLGELLVVAAMREQTPYYMTTATHVMLVGLVAIGLTMLGEGGAARALRGGVVASVLIACVAATIGFARLEIRGAWPFAWVPMFDVRHTSNEIIPLLLTPTYAMDDSGRFLCAQDRPAIHGAYGSQLLHNYAMDMRLACGRADVHVGGHEPERTHWLGLSRDMYAKIGVRPAQRIGPIGVVPAHAVSENAPLVPADVPRYPAYHPEIKDVGVHHFSVPLRTGEHVAISNLAFAFNYEPKIAVQFAGKSVEAIAQDRVAAIYAPSGAAATAEIDITTGDIFDIDIVVF